MNLPRHFEIQPYTPVPDRKICMYVNGDDYDDLKIIAQRLQMRQAALIRQVLHSAVATFVGMTPQKDRDAYNMGGSDAKADQSTM